MSEKTYMRVDEVMEALGVKQDKAYQVIRALNEELKSKGYITVSGRVNRKYFGEKYMM